MPACHAPPQRRCPKCATPHPASDLLSRQGVLTYLGSSIYPRARYARGCDVGSPCCCEEITARNWATSVYVCVCVCVCMCVYVCVCVCMCVYVCAHVCMQTLGVFLVVKSSACRYILAHESTNSLAFIPPLRSLSSRLVVSACTRLYTFTLLSFICQRDEKKRRDTRLAWHPCNRNTRWNTAHAAPPLNPAKRMYMLLGSACMLNIYSAP